MKEVSLSNLSAREELRQFVYHIRGIVEAAENVVALVAKLNSAYERDADAFATTTSRLEVEALDHLGYHVKSLRTPLRRLQREAYARLEENDKRAGRHPRKNAAKEKAKNLAGSRRVSAPATRLKR
jgi:hypothetical protein